MVILVLFPIDDDRLMKRSRKMRGLEYSLHISSADKHAQEVLKSNGRIAERIRK